MPFGWRTGEVDLVIDRNAFELGWQPVEDLAVGFAGSAARIDQQQYDVGPFDFPPGAFDTDFFDFVIGFAQAGGIDDVQWNSLDLDGRPQGIARRPGNRRDDGQIVAGQPVEQRGLADVRLARQNDVQARLQQLALAGP